MHLRKHRQHRRAGLAVAATVGLTALTALTGTVPTATATAAAAATASPTNAAADGGGYLAPYFTEGDLTGDRQVTTADLEVLAEAMGARPKDPSWAEVAPADLDGDERITVTDLAALSQRVLFDDGSFELVEASALEMQKAMNAGVVTSVELTQAYLDRIRAYDATVVDASPTGRALHSVIATSDVALQAAAASDAARARHDGPTGMLDGIPVLVKDNYDTVDMPTSAGCSCWEHNRTDDDAHMVEGLRAAGAIILGKASMDEFAFGFSSQFSTGSPVGSSRLVASPYETSRTAGGSSGGTGAAIAANLGAIGFGTDTGGSIRVPSSYNQLVGLRPTVGLASRDGIVPLALSQDTGGPMGRSVSDVAIALDAVVGSDPADPVTAGADAEVPDSYTAALDPEALQGRRFGYLPQMVPPATASNAGQRTARRLFLEAVETLRAQGAAVEEVTIPGIDPVLGEGSGSTNEFRHDLEAYVDSHLDPSVPLRSLGDIVASGKHVPSYRNTYVTRGAVTEEAYDAWMARHSAVLAGGKDLVTGALDQHGLDALVYPSGTPYGTYSTNMRLSPNTGLPALSVPMGHVVAADGSVTGAGVNLELLGRAYDEATLLGVGYAFEQATAYRTSPALYPALDGDVAAGPGDDHDPAGTGAVRAELSTRTVSAGDTFTVTVDQSAADLFAYQLSLGFDPRKVAVVDVAGPGRGFLATEQGDGELTVSQSLLGTSPAAQGETTLVTVTFEALRAGSPRVDLTEVRTLGASLESAEAGPVAVTR